MRVNHYFSRPAKKSGEVGLTTHFTGHPTSAALISDIDCSTADSDVRFLSVAGHITMKMIATLLLYVLCSQTALPAQRHAGQLPPPARFMLDRRFPGWRFGEVSQEVRRFFESSMKGASPYHIIGDFDGNNRADHAVLIWHGQVRDEAGKAIGPQSYLVVFLRRRGASYRMHIIKDPNGEYLCLATRGAKDYNYEEQKFIRYENDAILTGIFEKGGSSYVYKNGKFRSFVSSD